jgi:hypothetical protein
MLRSTLRGFTSHIQEGKPEVKRRVIRGFCALFRDTISDADYKRSMIRSSMNYEINRLEKSIVVGAL